MMTVETPLLTAFVATAGAVLIAVIGLIASVHYRLGKLERGQEALAANQEKGDADIREMVIRENVYTREMIVQNREMNVQTREMAAQEDAHTREMIVQTREMAAQEDAHTREMIVQTREMISQTREFLSQLIMQEIAALRERSDAQHAETIGAIQRLTDAFLSHSHDTDGTIRFRIPPPAVLPPDEQSRRADDEP